MPRIEPSWILIVISIVQIIQVIGRWTGKIDVSELKNSKEIDKIKDTQYKFIQWQQVINGKVGIAENDILWIKRVLKIK